MGESDKFCAKCGSVAPGVTSGGAAYSSASAPPPLSHSQMLPMTPLMRSMTNRKIAGVCGGIAKYFDVDPTIVRVLFVALFFCPVMPAIIPYIVCWIVMPLERPVAVHIPQQVGYPGSGMAPAPSYAPMPR
jgi:phage shock protein C